MRCLATNPNGAGQRGERLEDGIGRGLGLVWGAGRENPERGSFQVRA